MVVKINVRPLIAATTVVLVLCVLTYGATAQVVSSGNSGTTSANFLKMGVGARASALGGAFVAIADDATASYWNPAGLPQISHTELIFMHNDWYQDIKSNYLGAAFPVSNSFAFGLGISYLDYGSFDGYNSDDQPTGEYSANALVLSTSGAYQISHNLSVGVTGKIFSEKLERSSATSYAADFGALYRTAVVSMGLNLMNVGNGMMYETAECPLPRRLVAGLAVRAYDGKLKFASDLEMLNDRGLTIHQGVEYCYERTVFLRTGYSHDFSNIVASGSSGMTMGIGVKHSIGAIDYSYWPDNQLGDVHKISFRLAFGGVE
jgi:hypothetical protein